MRPHVELIQQSDLCWHPAEPHGAQENNAKKSLMMKKMDLVQQKSFLKPLGIVLADITKQIQNGLCLRVKSKWAMRYLVQVCIGELQLV